MARQEDPRRCPSCRHTFTTWVVWLHHTGGPRCLACADREPTTRERIRVYVKTMETKRLSLSCDGGCGLFVLDLRNRGQTVLACSDRCRRLVFAAYRRQARRRARMWPRYEQRLPSFARCAECATELAYFRQDARYCSTRCRVRAHRRRDAAAVEPNGSEYSANAVSAAPEK
jgi:hypothetical protein